MDKSKRKITRKLSFKQKLKKIEPKLQDVINYLRDHPNLLRFEKNPYTAERLMMLLDNEKLAALEDEFNEHPNGIELANFIWLMKCAIVHPVDEKYELVTGLIKLFQDIDINGDKHMEWSEFTQYIIDAVIGEKDARFFDARFEKERELTENEIIDKAYSRKTKRYVQSKFFDNSTHSNLIKKVQYSPHSDVVILLEQSSNTLKFYTTDCQEKIINKKKIGLTVPAEYNKVSFIIDFTVADSINTIGVITSKKQIIFWESSFAQKLIKSSKLDVLQTGIWYLPLHQLWVTAGDDFNLKTWIFAPSIQTGDKKVKLSHDKMLKAHKGKIMDVQELTAPRLVASASLDGKIKLWDLTDSEPRLLTELRDPSNCERGVRQLTYSHQYGSNLLSVGFEQHINVWCPEISITRAFIGRLEGHSSLVVQCKFIPISPNVISIDDKCNIRIWDIRSMSTIQVIAAEGGYSLITDVCFITGKYDRFILAGKRITYFENAEVQKNMKSANDEIYPLNIDFNIYFNQLVVLTKIDMRLYDAMTGRLKKVFNEIHDDKYSVELSLFCFGARQRKFFLADNAGMIRQYNMKNGEFLKKVNDVKEIEDSEFSKKQSHIKKKETNEVSSLLYINEEKLLITSYWDSTIRIYDESESEESVLLKVLSGAHKDSEIISLSYSAKQNLLASGSSNGVIALWDFETGKLEGILKADESEVIQIEFLDPYPIILTTNSSGAAYLWGSRLAPMKYKYKAIIKIMNTLWVNGVETNVTINSVLNENQMNELIPRELPSDGFEPPEVGAFSPIIQKNQGNEKTSKAKKLFFVNPITNEDSFLNSPNQLNGNPKDSQTINTNHNLLTTHLFKDEVVQSPIRPKFDNESSPKNQEDQKETYEIFQKYWDLYDINITKQTPLKNPLCYVYVGDSKGLMHIWNLTDILVSRQIYPIKEDKKKQSFQLRRKDLINATKAADNMMSGLERRNNKNLLVVHATNSVLLKRWTAHTGIVNKLTKIQEPPTIFSCSHDKTIKIWSLKGQYFSKINLIQYDKPNQWYFPFDWVNQKLNDLDLVFDSLKIIENEQLVVDQKDKVRMKYLTNKYFNDGEHNELQKIVIEQEVPEVNEKEKQKIEEEEAKMGVRIIYDTKPQPSLQDEFAKIYQKFEQEKEEEENRLKRLAQQEKESNQVDLDQIKKYYNVDKYTKDINMLKLLELNGNFNQIYYPNDDENMTISPQLNMYAKNLFGSKDQQALNQANNAVGQSSADKLKLKNSMTNFRIKQNTKVFTNIPNSTTNQNVQQQNLVSPLIGSNNQGGLSGVFGSIQSSKQSPDQFNNRYSTRKKTNTPLLNYQSTIQLPSNPPLPVIQPQTSQSQLRKGTAEMKTTGENFKTKKSSDSLSQSSQTKKIFSLSTTNFLRNNAFVSSITKHLHPKTKDDDKFKPQIDVKYKLGEVHRCYRVASYKYAYSVASDSPQILFADNDLLQKKMKSLKQLHAKKNNDDDDEEGDFQDLEDESDNENTDEPSRRGSAVTVTRKENKKGGDDSQSLNQSVGFSSFMSKQKTTHNFNKQQ